jgi:hypothetical protein
VTRQQLIQMGGAGLFAHFPSVKAIVMEAFPNFEWEPHKFGEKTIKSRRHQLGKDEEDVLEDLKAVEQQLGIKHVDVFPFLFSFFLKKVSVSVSHMDVFSSQTAKRLVFSDT